jgi:SAM-dependent methyltransferase
MAALNGIEFFEREDTHAAYQARRATGKAPNEVMEEDAFDELLGEVAGTDILDLGCGDGSYGRKLLDRGCASYTGVDGSARMTEVARHGLSGTQAAICHGRIEHFALAERAWDIVISRMTFHWIVELGPILARVAAALRPGGRLVFSVEHPVITCCSAARPDGEHRSHWLVDEYFVPGARTTRWFGVTVEKFHRSIEDYFRLIHASRLRVADLREATPSERRIPDPAEYRRRCRIPLMLLLRAEREGG